MTILSTLEASYTEQETGRMPTVLLTTLEVLGKINGREDAKRKERSGLCFQNNHLLLIY